MIKTCYLALSWCRITQWRLMWIGRLATKFRCSLPNYKRLRAALFVWWIGRTSYWVIPRTFHHIHNNSFFGLSSNLKTNPDGSERRNTNFRRFTYKYITHSSWPATIHVKNGSPLYRKSKETQVAVRTFH